MEVIAKTDIGNVREVNQDYVKIFQKNDHECLAVLCDGMGGHRAGEIASLLACEDIIASYQKEKDLQDEVSIKVWLHQAIMHAHEVVHNKGLQDQALEGMGTTVVIALLKNQHLYVSHVGDSRAYLYHDKSLTQLTRDDTLVNALLTAGTISKDEALFHPQKNVLLQAVGVSEKIVPSFISLDIKDGLVLLCSDGLYNSLFDEQMVAIFNQDKDIEDYCLELIQKANQYGGKDNIGVILLKDKGVEG